MIEKEHVGRSEFKKHVHTHPLKAHGIWARMKEYVPGWGYSQAEIDAFFEGETGGGKKQVHWNSLTGVPGTFTPSAHAASHEVGGGDLVQDLAGPVTITQNGDIITFSHDGTDAYVKWSDGGLILKTDEGVNAITRVRIKGKGTFFGMLNIFDQDDAESMDFYTSTGFGYITTTGVSPAGLKVLHEVPQNFTLWQNIGSGNPYLYIYGWKTGVGGKYGRVNVTSGGAFVIESQEMLRLNAVTYGQLQHNGTNIIYWDATYGFLAYDNIPFSVGDSGDYAWGYHQPTDSLQIVDGHTLNANIRAKLNASGYWEFYNRVGVGVAPLVRFHISGGHVYVGDEANNARHLCFRRNAATIGGMTSQSAVFSLFGGADGSQMHLTVRSTSYVGVGQPTPTAQFHIKSSVSAIQKWERTGNIWGMEISGADGIGLYNYIGATFAWWVSNAGYVGIGTTAPGAKLDVEDITSGIHELIRLSHANAYDAGAKISWWMDDAAESANILSAWYSASISKSYMSFSTYGPSLLERMRIDGDGNVGIGTAVPGAKLEVYASGADVELLIHEDAGTHDAVLHFRRGSGDWHLRHEGGLLLTYEDVEYFRFATAGLYIRSQKEIRFYDNGNYVGFKAPALVANQIWTLPTADADADKDVLVSNSGGVLSWYRPNIDWIDDVDIDAYITPYLNCLLAYNPAGDWSAAMPEYDIRWKSYQIEWEFWTATPPAPWAYGALNAGTVIINSSDNHPGWASIKTRFDGDATSSGYYWVAANNELSVGGLEQMDFVFRTHVPLTGVRFRMGFQDSITTAVPVDGIYFEVAADATLRGVCRANNDQEVTGTTYAIVVNTWYRGRIIVSSACDAVQFRLYNEAGALLWSATNLTAAKIPSGSARAVGFGVVAWLNFDDNLQSVISIDLADLICARGLTR